MLQRPILEPIKQGVLAFCYECPASDLEMAAVRSLGREPNCDVQRYDRIVKTDRRVMKRLGPGRLARVLAGLGNALLNIRGAPRHQVSGLEISPRADRLGEELSVLDQKIGGEYGIRSRARAEVLNRRYREDRYQEYQTLVVRQRRELTGFDIFRISSHDVHLVELFGAFSPEVSLQLLGAVADEARREPVQTLTTSISKQSNLLVSSSQSPLQVPRKDSTVGGLRPARQRSGGCVS